MRNKRLLEVLEHIEGNARLIHLEAVKLIETHQDYPSALHPLIPEIKTLAEELDTLRKRLYQLHTRVLQTLEDNSAEALRKEFF